MAFSPKAKQWKHVPPVLLTAVVPVFAVLAFFALATIAKNSPRSTKNEPSMAAFDACLTNNNLQPAQSYATQFDEQVAADQEMKVCGNLIPPEIIQKQQQQAETANAAYRSCIEGFVGSGPGRFHGGFHDAAAACQSLLQGGGGGGGRGSGPIVPKKNAPGPIA